MWIKQTGMKFRDWFKRHSQIHNLKTRFVMRQVHQSRPQLVKSHNKKVFWEAIAENAETNHFLIWLQDNSSTPRLHIGVSIAIYETIERFCWLHNAERHYRSSDSQHYNYRKRFPTKCFAFTCSWHATITSLWRHQCACIGLTITSQKITLWLLLARSRTGCWSLCHQLYYM